MQHSLAACLALTLLAAAPSPARAALVQMCIGTTAYVVRDEAGRVLGPQEMKRLTIKSFNGIPLERRVQPHDPSLAFYEGETTVLWDRKPRRETVRVLGAANPLVFGLSPPLVLCGELGELTLGYNGKQMRLLFDIRRHNTYFEIDSLPFQDGTFHLGSLACRDCAYPPAIDNNTTGKCLVPAGSWEGIDDGWVRFLIPKGSWGARIGPPTGCSESTIRVIDNQKDWAAAWSANREVAGGNPLPFVDFDVEMVLAVYLAAYPVPTFGHDSILVDKNGDLTFWPARMPPGYRYDPSFCTLFYFQVYRSGIASIAGKPLVPKITR